MIIPRVRVEKTHLGIRFSDVRAACAVGRAGSSEGRTGNVKHVFGRGSMKMVTVLETHLGAGWHYSSSWGGGGQASYVYGAGEDGGGICLSAVGSLLYFNIRLFWGVNVGRHSFSYLLRSLIIRFWKSDEMPLLKQGRDSRPSFNRGISVCLSVCLSCTLSVWWLGCRWRWGLRSAMLMSFRRRGKGPSLMIASCGQNNSI